MTIEKIEARVAENARIKANLIFERGTAKIEGRSLENKISTQSIHSIELNKFSNSFDMFDLKWNRWGGISAFEDDGTIDPVPFKELHGNLLHLKNKLDRFIEQL